MGHQRPVVEEVEAAGFVKLCVEAEVAESKPGLWECEDCGGNFGGSGALIAHRRTCRTR